MTEVLKAASPLAPAGARVQGKGVAILEKMRLAKCKSTVTPQHPLSLPRPGVSSLDGYLP